MLQNSVTTFRNNYSDASGNSTEYAVALGKQKEVVAGKNAIYENAKLSTSVALDRLANSSVGQPNYLQIRQAYNNAKSFEAFAYNELLSAKTELARLEGYSNKDAYEKAVKEARDITASKKADWETAKLKVEEIKNQIAVNSTSELQGQYQLAKGIEKSTYDVYTKTKSQSDELERYYTKMIKRVGGTPMKIAPLSKPKPTPLQSPKPIPTNNNNSTTSTQTSSPKKEEEAPTDTIEPTKSDIDVKPLMFSAVAFIAGAVGGYFVGKKMEKNVWLFAGIGGVALGLVTYGITTKFVYPTEKTSGFLTPSKDGRFTIIE